MLLRYKTQILLMAFLSFCIFTVVCTAIANLFLAGLSLKRGELYDLYDYYHYRSDREDRPAPEEILPLGELSHMTIISKTPGEEVLGLYDTGYYYYNESPVMEKQGMSGALYFVSSDFMKNAEPVYGVFDINTALKGGKLPFFLIRANSPLKDEGNTYVQNLNTLSKMGKDLYLYESDKKHLGEVIRKLEARGYRRVPRRISIIRKILDSLTLRGHSIGFKNSLWCAYPVFLLAAFAHFRSNARKLFLARTEGASLRKKMKEFLLLFIFSNAVITLFTWGIFYLVLMQGDYGSGQFTPVYPGNFLLIWFLHNVLTDLLFIFPFLVLSGKKRYRYV